MKRFHSFLFALLVVLCVFAAPPAAVDSTDTQSKIQREKKSVVTLSINNESIAIDSAEYDMLADIQASAIDEGCDDNDFCIIYNDKAYPIDDNRFFIIHNGETYPISTLLENLIKYDEQVATAPHIGATPELLCQAQGILVIVIGAPCLAIIVALIVWLVFLLQRNRQRNKIIEKAIDNNYQLPDTFYNHQPPVNRQNSSCNPKYNQNGPQLADTRDPRKFSTAMTLIGVGFAILLYFIIKGMSFGIIAGGIPLLLGIGKLIGYFYVPGFASQKNHNDMRYPNYGPQAPYYSSSYPADYQQEFNNTVPQQSQQPPCPPPYNPASTNSPENV